MINLHNIKPPYPDIILSQIWHFNKVGFDNYYTLSWNGIKLCITTQENPDRVVLQWGDAHLESWRNEGSPMPDTSKIIEI